MIYQKNNLILSVLSLALSLVTIVSLEQNSVQSAPEKTAAPAKSELSSAKFKASDVIGSWKSEWGPVNFEHSKDGIFSGSWKEGQAKIGKISDGKFSQADGKLSFNFVETWTGLKGHAVLHLSDNCQQLGGSWLRGKDKGEWTMHRAATGK
jgi:hypothetical protein